MGRRSDATRLHAMTLLILCSCSSEPGANRIDAAPIADARVEDDARRSIDAPVADLPDAPVSSPADAILEDDATLPVDARQAIDARTPADAAAPDAFVPDLPTCNSVTILHPGRAAFPAIDVTAEGQVHATFVSADGAMLHAQRSASGPWSVSPIATHVDGSADRGHALYGGRLHVAYYSSAIGRKVLYHASGPEGGWTTEVVRDPAVTGHLSLRVNATGVYVVRSGFGVGGLYFSRAADATDFTVEDPNVGGVQNVAFASNDCIIHDRSLGGDSGEIINRCRNGGAWDKITLLIIGPRASWLEYANDQLVYADVNGRFDGTLAYGTYVFSPYGDEVALDDSLLDTRVFGAAPIYNGIVASYHAGGELRLAHTQLRGTEDPPVIAHRVIDDSVSGPGAGQSSVAVHNGPSGYPEDYHIVYRDTADVLRYAYLCD